MTAAKLAAVRRPLAGSRPGRCELCRCEAGLSAFAEPIARQKSAPTPRDAGAKVSQDNAC